MNTETTLNILQDKKVKRLEDQLAVERETVLRFAAEIGQLSQQVTQLRRAANHVLDTVEFDDDNNKMCITLHGEKHVFGYNDKVKNPLAEALIRLSLAIDILNRTKE